MNPKVRMITRNSCYTSSKWIKLQGVMVLVSVWLDKLLGAAYVRTVVCLSFIANEGLSILENLGLMGVPLPGFLKSMLEAMKERADSGKTEDQS